MNRIWKGFFLLAMAAALGVGLIFCNILAIDWLYEEACKYRTMEEIRNNLGVLRIKSIPHASIPDGWRQRAPLANGIDYYMCSIGWESFVVLCDSRPPGEVLQVYPTYE